jgi:hypothetical protein
MISFPSLVSVLPAFPAGFALNETYSLPHLSANPPPTFKGKFIFSHEIDFSNADLPFYLSFATGIPIKCSDWRQVKLGD